MVSPIKMRIEAILFTVICIGVSCLVAAYRELNKYWVDGWMDGWANFIPDLSDSSPPIYSGPTSRIMLLKMKMFS